MPAQPAHTALLDLQALSVLRDERVLFAPLTMSISPGQCVEILGPNGAGKTTLLRTLAGLHGQYEGSFQLSDCLYQGHPMGLDELLSPLDNLAWYCALQGTPVDDQRMQTVLEQVGMMAEALTPCQQLSQGQQRRVCMARWLLSPAKLWLLDEPYTSLDRDGQALLNKILSAHCASDGVVVAATHVSLTVTNRISVDIQPLGEVQYSSSDEHRATSIEL